MAMVYGTFLVVEQLKAEGGDNYTPTLLSVGISP
jgi:hypothetical protein